MKLKDFNLLKKFMAMTTSENDNEALQALRRANAVLLQYQRTWVQVLDRVIHVDAAVEEDPETEASSEPARPGARPSQPSDYVARVNAAISAVLDDARPGSFRDLILDFQAQWEDKHFLSERQHETLFRALDRVRNHR